MSKAPTQKILLQIGYTRILLSSDKGLKAIIDALNSAQNVYYHSLLNDSVEIDDIDPIPEVTATYLPLKTKLTYRSIRQRRDEDKQAPLALPALTLRLKDKEAS